MASTTPVGDFAIDGVPGTASRIGLEYFAPGGSLGHGLLPTGRVRDCFLKLQPLENGSEIEVSVVDAANPVVFVRAADLGMTATESPPAIDAHAAADRCPRVYPHRSRSTPADTEPAWPSPKSPFVAPPQDYLASDGKPHRGRSVDLCIRMLSMGKAHRTLAMTTAICAAVAAAVDGSVVAEVARPSADGASGWSASATPPASCPSAPMSSDKPGTAPGRR